MDKSKKPIKVKILHMNYDDEDHIFTMAVHNIESAQDVNFAMRAEDFGISRDIPIEIIYKFCSDMEGKEKNLMIEIEKDKMVDTYKRNKGKLSEEEVSKLHGDLDRYPYKELIRKQMMENEDNENKNFRRE